MIRRPRAALCAVTTALSLYALLLVVSCTSDSFTSLQPAELRISANVQSTPIASLVVTVSASDINPSLVFNLTLESGIASGTLRVPAGAARTFTLRAFDATGLETHRGATTIDIVAGPNPTIAVLLHPIAGQQPIEATFGTLTISIAAVPGGVGQQESVQLTATVTGPGGPIAVGPGDIRWATATPATLTVDPATGLAKGRAHGDARVVATYAGTAGVATIAVDPVIIAAGDIAECTGVPPVPGDAEKETAIIVDSLVGLVLPLGDNAYEDGTLDEYTNCYDKAWPFKNRSRPVPGNHEYNTPGATGYYDFWGDLAGERGKGYYSYELGKWHLIALNSELSSAAMTAQLAWLQTDLSLTTAK